MASDDERILAKHAIIDDGETWGYSSLLDMMALARQAERERIFKEMRRLSKELTCDDTCANNPRSCEMEQRMIRAFEIIMERMK